MITYYREEFIISVYSDKVIHRGDKHYFTSYNGKVIQREIIKTERALTSGLDVVFVAESLEVWCGSQLGDLDVH